MNDLLGIMLYASPHYLEDARREPVGAFGKRKNPTQNAIKGDPPEMQ